MNLEARCLTRILINQYGREVSPWSRQNIEWICLDYWPLIQRQALILSLMMHIGSQLLGICVRKISEWLVFILSQNHWVYVTSVLAKRVACVLPHDEALLRLQESISYCLLLHHHTIRQWDDLGLLLVLILINCLIQESPIILVDLLVFGGATTGSLTREQQSVRLLFFGWLAESRGHFSVVAVFMLFEIFFSQKLKYIILTILIRILVVRNTIKLIFKSINFF